MWALIILVSLYLLCAGVVIWVTRNNDLIKLEDCLNPRNWVSYVTGHLMMRLLPPHVLEQYILRLFDSECRECVTNGKCHHCGCDMPARAYDPFTSCSAGNWGPIIFDKSKYAKLREEYPIEIQIKYTNDSI